jgi:hypothetical protein
LIPPPSLEEEEREENIEEDTVKGDWLSSSNFMMGELMDSKKEVEIVIWVKEPAMLKRGAEES